MIAGGSGYLQSAYILNVKFEKSNPANISRVTTTSLPNIPFEFHCGFYENCDERIIIHGNTYIHGKYPVAELDSNAWIDNLPSTRIGRSSAAVAYHSKSKSLIVTGGWHENMRNLLNSYEILQIDSDGNGKKWQLYGEFPYPGRENGPLPHPVGGHTMTQFQNDLILTGGRYDLKSLNEVWKGILQENKISFEPLPPMKQQRAHHFAFHFEGNIFVFGGEENDKENSSVELYNGKNWIDGPILPYYLSKWNGDNAVMNRNGKILIFSNENGIGIFDTENLSVNVFENQFTLRDNRSGYAAVVI